MTVWVGPDVLGGETVPVGKYFVRVLEQLGYNAELNVVSADSYEEAINDPSRHVQIGPMAWGPDYLAESGFIPALTCDAAAGAEVGPGFCPPTIERRIDEATHVQLTDAAASHDLWSDLDHDLVDLAAWVPLWNGEWADPVSERRGRRMRAASGVNAVSRLSVRADAPPRGTRGVSGRTSASRKARVLRAPNVRPAFRDHRRSDALPAHGAVQDNLLEFALQIGLHRQQLGPQHPRRDDDLVRAVEPSCHRLVGSDCCHPRASDDSTHLGVHVIVRQ